MNRLVNFCTITLFILLASCSNITQKPVEENNTTTELINEKIEVDTKPFSSQTLYSLLVAEIAGQRKRYDIFLGNYMQQANQTRDPKVAERATQIARYLQADQAALNSALLWSDISPDNNEALSIAAYQLAKVGRLDEAIAKVALLLNKGTNVQVQSITVMALRADTDARNHYELAIDSLIINYPNNETLIISKALLLQRNNQLEAALDLSEQVRDINNKNYHAVILSARLLQQLKRAPAAIDIFEQALRTSPKNNRIRVQYARLLASFDTPKAQEQFTLLLTQSPNDPTLVLSLALLNKENGQLKDASRLLERLLKMEKLTSSAHYYLGLIAEEQELWDDALDHYEKVSINQFTNKGLDVFSAMARYGTILLKQNKIERFSTKLDQIRVSFPKIAQQLYLLESELLVEVDMHQIAYDKLTAALEDHALDTKLLYARSMVSERMNNIEQSEIDLRQILSTTPDNVNALNALGYTLADKTDRYEEAKELIERALSISPNDPAIMDSLGWVEFRLGNYESSLLRLRSAFSKYQDHEVAAHLGEVLWTLKHYDEAKKVWRKGLELNPSSKIIPVVVRRLVADPDTVLKK